VLILINLSDILSHVETAPTLIKPAPAISLSGFVVEDRNDASMVEHVIKAEVVSLTKHFLMKVV
jgi:hypothetical protein